LVAKIISKERELRKDIKNVWMDKR
jgi:hypothetical protein